MVKCKDCKYATPKNDEFNRIFCSNEHFIYDPWNEQKGKDDKLEYWDYESYIAGFDVGPDFGCIHAERADGLTECCATCRHIYGECDFLNKALPDVCLNKMLCREWQPREEK